MTMKASRLKMIKKYEDEDLVAMATEFILLEPSEKCQNRARLDYNFAFSCVKKLHQNILDDPEKDFDYMAFSLYLKSELLPAGHYGNPQYFYHEEVFLLYLAKPRQIVEACLLAAKIIKK